MSKDPELQQFVPRFSHVIQDTTPEALAARRQAALDNPELRAAIADARRQTTPTPVAPAPDVEVTQPSPWVRGEAERVDAAALPSALAAPRRASDPPEPKPVRGSARVRSRWLVVALLGITAPLMALSLGRAARAPAALPSVARAPQPTSRPADEAPAVDRAVAEAIAREAPTEHALAAPLATATAEAAPTASATRAPKAAAEHREPREAEPSPPASSLPAAPPPEPRPIPTVLLSGPRPEF